MEVEKNRVAENWFFISISVSKSAYIGNIPAFMLRVVCVCVCAKNFSSYFIIELFAVVNSGLETKIYDKKSIKPAQKKEQGKIVCLVVFVYAVGRQR